jgi:hypothetical protein
MLLSLLFITSSWLSSTPAEPPQTRFEFLESIRIVGTSPSEGALTLVDPNGKSRMLEEGDVLEEAEGARIKSVGRTTIVLTRVVTGSEGETGESLIVVRFDGSGRTRVREYRTVPDVSLSQAPPPKR